MNLTASLEWNRPNMLLESSGVYQDFHCTPILERSYSELRKGGADFLIVPYRGGVYSMTATNEVNTVLLKPSAVKKCT